MRTRQCIQTLLLISTAWSQETGQDDCFATISGCTCLKQWSYKGQTNLSGCANPDNDELGPWCLTEEQTECSNGFPLSILPGDQQAPYDYCLKDCNTPTDNPSESTYQSSPVQQQSYEQEYQETYYQEQVQDKTKDYSQDYSQEQSSEDGTCYTSYAGCKCLDSWSYKGVDGLSGCANPDNDTIGSWCIVEESEECLYGRPLNTLPLAGNAPFDYCNAECKTITEDQFKQEEFLDNFHAQNQTILMQKGIATALSSVFIGTVDSVDGVLPWNSGDFFFDFDNIFDGSFAQGIAGSDNVLVGAQAQTSGDNSFAQAYGEAQTESSFAYVEAVATPGSASSSALVIQDPNAEEIAAALRRDSPSIISLPTSSPSSGFSIEISEPDSSESVPIPVGGDQPLSQREAEYLAAHNAKRDLHCVDPFVWDAELAAQSQAYANQCIFEHSNAPGVGENLFLAKGIIFDPEDVVQAWYEEIADFDFSRPRFTSGTGHFTQIVWKETTAVGCGEVITCSDGAHIVVCQYRPPGNFIGRFAEQVLPPCK